MIFAEENLILDKELSIVRSLRMPKDYSCTDYVFYSRATYKDISASSADIFSVLCEKSEKPAPKLFDWQASTVFLIALVICLLFVVFFTTSKYKKTRAYVKSLYAGLMRRNIVKRKTEYPQRSIAEIYKATAERPTAANLDKETQNFKELLRKLEISLRNKEIGEAKKNYSKLNKLYIGLNKLPVSKEKKVRMYGVLKKEYEKLIEERKKE